MVFLINLIHCIIILKQILVEILIIINILSNKNLIKIIPYFIKINQNNNIKYQRSDSTKKIYGSFQL